MRAQGLVTTGLVFTALFAGCATAPTRNDQLEQARAEVASLGQQPEAGRAAAEQLRAAQDALQRADAEFQNHGDQADVSHLAYIAMRQAEIGQARIEEAHAHEQISKGDAARAQILLQARAGSPAGAAARAGGERAIEGHPAAARGPEGARDGAWDGAHAERRIVRHECGDAEAGRHGDHRPAG